MGLQWLVTLLFLAQFSAAKLSWYAAYDLTAEEISTLTETGCYRGLYGGPQRLSLFTCPHAKAQKFAEMNENAFLCVVELRNPITVRKALSTVSYHNSTHQVLFSGEQEIVIVSTQEETEKPDLCDALIFNEVFMSLKGHRERIVDNTVYVPRLPILPPSSGPIDNPAFVKSMGGAAIVRDDYIADLIKSIHRSQVEHYTRTLATGHDGSNTKITRNSYAIRVGTGGCADATWRCSNWATQYIVDELNSLFKDYPGVWSVTTSSFRTDMCHNVVLDIEGRVNRNRFVLTGSHLDSRNTGSGPTATGVAPGADDNGSGSATNLAIARLIADHKVRFANSVRMMWFCGEEQGLYGSQALATQYRNQGLNVQAMFNMDMIGYTDSRYGITLTFSTRSVTPALRASCEAFAKTYMPDLKQGASSGCCSDEQSFYNAGFPSLGIFETPTTSVVYPRYHQVGDTWDNGLINYEQIHQFAQAISSCILEYSQPLAPGK